MKKVIKIKIKLSKNEMYFIILFIHLTIPVQVSNFNSNLLKLQIGVFESSYKERCTVKFNIVIRQSFCEITEPNTGVT